MDWILIGCFIKLSVQMFQSLIITYRRGNLVYLHWGCTSFYRSLSYPLRSLGIYTFSISCLFNNIFKPPEFIFICLGGEGGMKCWKNLFLVGDSLLRQLKIFYGVWVFPPPFYYVDFHVLQGPISKKMAIREE